MAEYIEREAVVKYLRSRKGNFLDDTGKSWSAGMEAAVSVCEKFPAADVAPVAHGRWEEWWPGISLIMTGEEMLCRCSACDAKYPDVEGYRHCPNCGAKMDGTKLERS